MNAARARNGHVSRRGFVLIAVMVIVGIAMLVVLATLILVRAETATAATHERSAQSRALAWSGVQAIGATLDRQRDRILAGSTPHIDGEITIYEAAGRLGVVRLVPFSDDEPIRAEAGRVDLNHADAAALAATGLVDAALAGRIVAARQARGGRFASELELLEVDGVTPEMLFGSLDRLASPTRGAGPGVARASSGREGAFGPVGVRSSAAGLLDVVTVHGVEPMLQRDGSPQLRLGDGWSEALERAVTEKFGAEFATALHPLVAGGTLVDDAALVAALRSRNVEPRDWPKPLDAFTTEPGDYHGGRLDLNSAPYEALLALPGITPPQAAELVRQRDGLSFDDRATATWPLLRGVVDADQFQAIADRVTVRCWMWRVRFEAGEVAASDAEGGGDDATAADSPSLDAPVIWEAVIDLTTPEWRVAYLRDATLLPVAIAMAAAPEARAERDDARRTAAASKSDDTPSTDAGGASTPNPSGSGAERPPDEPTPKADGPPDEPTPKADAPAHESVPSANAPKSDKPGADAEGAPSKPSKPTRPVTRPVGRWRT